MTMSCRVNDGKWLLICALIGVEPPSALRSKKYSEINSPIAQTGTGHCGF